LRVLVTGATGFIGTRLIEALLASGMEVTGTYRGTRPERPAVTWLPLTQIESSDAWAAPLAHVHSVVHLAALAHRTGAAANGASELDYARVNIEGTRALARACRAARPARVVFLSSISVYGRGVLQVDERTPTHPDDAYGRSKLAAEAALQAELSGGTTDWCILRPPLLYGRGAPGNLPRLQALVARGMPLPLGAVRNRRSFMFVDNLIDALLAVLRFSGDIRAAYVLSDGSDFATPELVRILAAGSGRRARLVSVPVTLLRLLGNAGDFAARVLNLPGPFDSRTIDSLVGTLTIDSSRFRSTFAWQPPLEGARAFSHSYGLPVAAAAGERMP